MPAGADVPTVHDIATAPLPHLSVLQEQAAVSSRVVCILGIKEGQRAARIIHIPDDGVLVYASAAAVGPDLVVHDVTEIVVAVHAWSARDFHHCRVETIDRRNTERAATAKLRQAGGLSGWTVEEFKVLANRRR